MELMTKLSELIRKKGVTAYQVSMESGVSQATLSQILNGGTKKMSNKTAKALSEYFEVSKDYLMKDQSNYVVSEDNSGTIVNNGGNGNSFFTHPEGVSGPCGGMIELLRKKDEQIDRLLTIIEHQNGINKE